MTSDLEHRIAQRFLVAEVLTKQWLMGIRRGWLSLLKPQVQTWTDIHKAIARLDEFVVNLKENVLFMRPGPYSSSEFNPEGKELRKAFKTLRDAIGDQMSRARHWEAAEQQDPSWIGRGTFSKAEGEKMRLLYTTEFANLMTTSVKVRRRLNPYREANLTELLDNILKILRVDAKDQEDRLRRDEERGITNTRDYLSQSSFREFSFGRMKVVVLAPQANRALVQGYVNALDRAHTLTSRKGFGKLWYGVVFLESTKNEKFTPEEQTAYAEYGYEDMVSRAGTYHSGSDEVVLTTPPTDAERVIIHELGHRYWFKFMTAANRARFNALVQTNVSKKVRDFPSGPTDEEGQEKPVLPVSSYGRKSIEEAFAEVFERYVSGGDLNQGQLESFRSVLAAHEDEKDSLAQQVVSRYLHAHRQ